MKNMKKLYIICLVSILILIWCLFHNNLIKRTPALTQVMKGIEKYEGNSNFENTGMYVLYVPKREQYIKDVMKKMKLNPEFVQGPDKNKLDLEQLKKDKIIETNIKLSRGEIACYLGHLNILKKFVESDYKYALIFEDDVKLPDNVDETYEKIKYSINNVPKNTDFLYLGFYREQCDKLIKYNDIYNHSYKPTGIHSYLINKKFANIILKNSYPINIEIDNLYNRDFKLKINRYSVNKNYLHIEQNFKLENTRENVGIRDIPPVCI